MDKRRREGTIKTKERLVADQFSDE